MLNNGELSFDMLKTRIDQKQLKFKNTKSLECVEDIIGQERAIKALEFGLLVKTRGYNLFLSGMTGTGKTSYAKNYIKKISKEKHTPDDWCYVYNFEKSNEPMALSLQAGMGKILQKDMQDFVKALKQEISRAFNNEDYEKEKASIMKEFQNKRNRLLEQLNIYAEKKGFKVRTTKTGIYFSPVVGGKILNEQQFEKLDEKLKTQITESSNLVQLQTIEIARRIKEIEKSAEIKVSEWESKIALFAVGGHIHYLKEKYKNYPKLQKYFDKVQDDILENLDELREEEHIEEAPQIIMPFFKKNTESPVDKYEVNLLVDNSNLKGVPLIVDFNPTYLNLIGRFEYENEFGSLTTDYTMIKSGLFHQANGGYLILQAKDILTNYKSWEALKRVLKTRKINIENIKEETSQISISTLKPEPIPVDIKVILIGTEYMYQMLYEIDEDFRKLFKIKVDFDYEMSINSENLLKLSQFIANFCNKEKTLHFTKAGVIKVVEYCSRLVEDQNKISTKFNEIAELLSEACAWADIEQARLVTDIHVKKAMDEKINRSNKYDKKLLELLQDGTIMVDTDGEVVGQINALTIIDTGDYSFGKPTRITANTFIGKSGIINIEREIEMSGTSHSKGVLILSGYIGQKFAQEIPLSLSASLCFEQMYQGIDGDSASSAELYTVLSSLADKPIKQCLAVTGSVNQKGELQAIGGVNEKIEGFFELCKVRGLTGRHGVIIPHQNVKNLVLNDEVVEAVKNKLFHIYAIKTVDEGIEILTGIKAGKKGANGKFEKNTINYLVYEKLKSYANTVYRCNTIIEKQK